MHSVSFREMLGKGHDDLYKPQQWKKEEIERLRGERDKIKFIGIRFESWQVVGSMNGERREDAP